jgi:hypothetical protein
MTEIIVLASQKYCAITTNNPNAMIAEVIPIYTWYLTLLYFSVVAA